MGELRDSQECEPFADLRIRRGIQADREAIMTLFGTGGRDSQADVLTKQWEWKFERNPFNPDETLPIWVAEVAGEIVAVDGALFVPFSIHGVEHLLAWGTDLMVHPDYRRRGIALRLLREKWRHLRFTGAYANRASYRLSIKTGVNIACSLPVAVRVLDVAGCIQAIFGGPRLMGQCTSYLHQLFRYCRAGRAKADRISISTGSWTDPRIDQLWHEVASLYHFSAVRSRPYLNWRYAQCPTHRYTLLFAEQAKELAGFTVLRTVRRGRIVAGYIVDMLARPDDQETMDALLAASVERLREQGAAFASIIATHELWRRSAGAHGFRSFPLLPRKFFQARMDGEVPEGFSELHLWHLTWGDCDHEMCRLSRD